MNEVITADGEVIEQTSLATIDTTALATLARVEIDHQIATARTYPRSIDRAVRNIVALATMDEDTAEECCYALVRKSKRRGGDEEENKPIEGPSIRLAEIAFSQYGNCRADARVIEVNRKEMYLAAEGVFHDLETNAAQKAVVRRRISTKSGRLFSEDMIIVTGNAACAIAKRNAILAGIPKGVYRGAYQKARQIIAGTAETLTVNRTKAIDAFKRFGVTPEQIFDVLEVEGEGDIKPSHIATMRAMFSTLKNGESTVEEMFGKPEPTHKFVKNPLADEPAQETDAANAAEVDGGGGHSPAETQGRGAATSVSEQESADAGETASDAAADPIFAAGVEAAMKGASRKAVPADVKRDEEKTALWHAGFDSVSGK